MRIDTSKIDKILIKLHKKDFSLFKAIQKKIFQISQFDIVAINHFKNLKAPMSHLKKVHIGSFILTFQVKNNTIFFEKFGHHDQAY